MTCTKPFSITVTATAPLPIAWWSLDQAPGGLVDTITLDPIDSSFTTGIGGFSSVAGKIGNAIRFLTPGGVGGSGELNEDSTAFGYTGNGFSLSFWLFNAPGSGFSFYDWFWIGSSGLDNGLTADSPQDLPGFINGQWNLIVYTWNETTGDFSYSVNNGAKVVFDNVPAVTHEPGYNGRLDFSYAFNALATRTWILDEVGAYFSDLTPGEITFLWNGGAGRGYPF